jgi:hypothetical protein
MALAAELERIHAEIAASRARGEELCRGLGEAELAWRSGAKRWSLAEILVHLRATCDVFLPAVDRAIHEARARRLFSEGPFRMGRLDRFYVWYVEPPVRFRLPAPAPVRPVLTGPATAALGEWVASQERMLARVEAANGLHLIRARVTSPLAGFVKMSLLGFFGVYTGHERRHLWQAENVRRQLEVARA